MVTPITSLNRKECELIPAAKIAAYTDITLDPENPTGIILDTSWGTTHLDLMDIVKAGETITHIYLSPVEDPQGICYEREDGQTDYISGDALSRIVSMQLLKDVDTTNPPLDGDVYQYDGTAGLFKPFDLKTFVTNTNLAIGRINAQITNIQNRLTAIEEKLTPPTNTPSDARVAFANVNFYGDHTNTNSHQHGVFAHDPTSDVDDDTYFS